MKPKKTSLLLAGSLTALLASPSAHAASQTWDNVAATSTWDATALNWAGAAWTDGNDAVFGATGAGAITVSGTRSVGDLALSSAGYSFSGGILSAAKLAATNNWTVGNDTTIPSGVTADFSPLGGASTGTLNKLGAGTLTLSGAVNATGVSTGSGNWAITVSAGSLVLSGTSAFSNAGLIVGGTGDATISGGTHNFTGTLQRRGLAMGSGRTVTISGGDVVTTKITVGNGSSGIFTQSDGTVNADLVELGTSGNSTDTSVFNLDGGSLLAVQLAPVTGWKGTSTINLNGGTFRAKGSSSNLFSASVTGSQAGSVFVKAGGVVIDPNGRDVIISSAMQAHPTSTGGGLTKVSPRMLTLSGANTYTGTTTIAAGTLGIGIASTRTGATITSGATGTGDVTLANGVAFADSGSTWYAPKVTLQGNITLGGVTRQTVGIKTLDLGGGTRTVNLTATGGNVFLNVSGFTATISGGVLTAEGTGRNRWEFNENALGSMTVQNGNLAVTSSSTGSKYVGFGIFTTVASFTQYNGNAAGLTIGNNVFFQTGSTANVLGSTTTTTPAMTVNGIWNLGGGTASQTVYSLAGSGQVNNATFAGGGTPHTVTLNGTTGTTTFSGTLNNGSGSASLSLSKTGASTQILSGANTYTGDTTVTGGTLGVTGSSIADANKLVIDGGQLDLTGAETVGTLFFGAVQQAAGTYSATGAGGTIASANFTGAGTLVVTSGPVVVSGYSTWASANAGSQDADLDFDNDGVSNGIEYFMGQTGSTFTANPSVVTVGAVITVTWPRDPAAVATFKVQISDTLAAGGWTDIVPPDASIDQSNPNQVTYTLPSGALKKFCRLSVTP